MNILFSEEVDQMLIDQGFHYSGPAMGKPSTYDWPFGENYLQRLRLFYSNERDTLYYNKPILIKMNGGMNIGFSDISEIKKELIVELKKLCK